MEEAKKLGIEMDGIEPNKKFCEFSRANGFNVCEGLFPKDFTLQKEYDFIIFNDVFEHLPKLESVLKSCNSLLKKNGMLIINCPNSRGFLFNVAKILQRFGMNDSWKRLWQVDFYSPHLWYFDKKNLRTLLKPYNFEPFANVKLRTLRAKGLSQRILCSCKTATEKFFGFIKYLVILLAIPILSILPNDILCQFYRKEG